MITPATNGPQSGNELQHISSEKSFADESSTDRPERSIGPLRKELTKYALYALAVFDRDNENLNKRLMAFMTNGAYGSETAGPFLISDQWRNFNYSFLDPFPPLQMIGKNPSCAPGVVFWNEDASAFVHISQADKALTQIMRAGQESKSAIT